MRQNGVEQKSHIQSDFCNDGRLSAAPNCSRLFTVSNNRLQAVLTSNIKSGIYKKVAQSDPPHHSNSSYFAKTMSDKLEVLANDILYLTADKFRIHKHRNLLVSKDNAEHKRFFYKIIEPRTLHLHPPNSLKTSVLHANKLKRKIGRPRNSSKVLPAIPTQIIPVSVTKSGRLSKPKADFECLADVAARNDLIKDSEQISLEEVKDKDFKYYKMVVGSSSKTDSTCEPVPEIETNQSKRIRKLPSDSKCPVCHKILLGKRMQKHFQTYPDHNINNMKKVQSSVYELSLYNFLVNKIKQTVNMDDNDQKTDLFLTELSDLINQIQSRNSKLVQSTSGMHFVSSKLSKMIGIPEGHYSINMNAIDSVPDPVASTDDALCLLRPLAPPQPRLADYNLSISLDDTLTAKLNLSDNINAPSEESLLRNVNDLVPHQSIKKLEDHDDISLASDVLQLSQNANKSNSVMHYDHASDNAVEAVNIKGSAQPPILDLSLDLYQFRST